MMQPEREPIPESPFNLSGMVEIGPLDTLEQRAHPVQTVLSSEREPRAAGACFACPPQRGKAYRHHLTREARVPGQQQAQQSDLA